MIEQNTLVAAHALEKFVIELFRLHGLSDEDAGLVANTLVQADLWGHQSHGVLRTSWYIERLRHGVMTPFTKVDVVRDKSCFAVIDGKEGVGQVIAKQDAENMGSLASVLAQTVPDLAAAVIALASDEPDAVDVVRSLPLPVQLDALIAVGKLTFTDEGAVPKFLAGLGGMLRAGASAAKMAPSVMR